MKLLIAAASVLVLSASAQAQMPAERIDAIAARVSGAFDATGMAVAVVSGDDIVFLKTCGRRAEAAAAPWTDHRIPTSRLLKFSSR
jgi:CubicO group peptidase (beta-lactamase class C family)